MASVCAIIVGEVDYRRSGIHGEPGLNSGTDRHPGAVVRMVVEWVKMEAEAVGAQ